MGDPELEPLDLDLARETYLSAWAAAMFAAHLADAGDLREVSRAARAAPAPAHPPRLIDLLLDGLALIVTDGRGVAAPVLRQAAAAFTSADTPAEERLLWTWLAQVPASYLWDFDSVLAITDEASQLARDAGALDQLPIDLQAQVQIATWSGDIPAAAALIREARVIAEATGTRIAARRHVPCRPARPGDRGRSADRGRLGGSHGRRPGNRGVVGALGDRDLV
jgi:hypothetical protein